jgi:hypothetical protein
MLSTVIYIVAVISGLIAVLIAVLARLQFEKEIGNYRITSVISLCVLLFAFISAVNGFELSVDEAISEEIQSKIYENYVNAEIIDININKNTYDGHFTANGNTYKFTGQCSTLEISNMDNNEYKILKLK